MSLSYPDLTDRTPVTISESFKEPIEGALVRLKCYIEDDSEIRYGSDGQPIEPKMIIMYPKGTVMNKGDYITIVKLHGQDPTTEEAVRRRVKLAAKLGASSSSHVEVIV